MVSDSRCGVRRAATPCAAGALNPEWRVALCDLAVACLMAALVLWPTAIELAASWQSSEAYRYAWLVVPMFVYLVAWHHRDRILAERPQPDAVGAVVAVVAAIAWSIAAAANIDIGRQLALIMVFQGIGLAALGRPLYRRWLPLMALPLLMLPSADLLLGPLRLLTLKAIEWFALASGMPYRSDGFLLHIGEHAYLVLEACAGLSHVTLTLFLGYCFALLVFRSMVKIVALALFAAALGVLANMLRVFAIVWLDGVRGYTMDLAAHGRIQWLALLVVLALLFYAMLRIRAEPAEPASCRALSVPHAQPPSGLMRRAPVVAGLAVLAIVGLTRVLLDDSSHSRPALSDGKPPAVLAGWQLDSPAAGWAAEGELRTLTLRYRADGRAIGLTLVETRVPGAKLLPALVLPRAEAGWRDVSRETTTACDGAHCVRLVHSLWKNDEEHLVRHVYYGYSIGRLQTHSGLLLRLATALSRLTGKRDPARLLAFSVDGEALNADQFSAIPGAFDADT